MATDEVTPCFGKHILHYPVRVGKKCLAMIGLIKVTGSPSSNWTCGFPASGFPMFFTTRHVPSSSPLLSALCTIRIYHSGVDCQTSHIQFPYPCSYGVDFIHYHFKTFFQNIQLTYLDLQTTHA
jgi:hypothetical protein